VAVLRQHPQVRLPDDFGLGLAVTAAVGGIVLLAWAAVASMPTSGPRGESRTPDPTTTYIDIPAAAPAASPLATH